MRVKILVIYLRDLYVWRNTGDYLIDAESESKRMKHY